MFNIFDFDDSHSEGKLYVPWVGDQDFSHQFSCMETLKASSQSLKTQFSYVSYSQPVDLLPRLANKTNTFKYSNPNLLKNLVTTLRSWIEIKDSIHGKLEAEIWRYFKQYKKINKQLVWMIYGNISQDLPRFEKLRQQIPFLTEISIQQYKKMQNNIKQQTILQLKKADIEHILKNRRVQNRQQFNSYFFKFVQQLQKI